MPRRALNQEMRRRKFLPSFGDIVLPVVGIAGVALLGIAGWHFFIDGIKTPPGISSTKAYAESPVLIAERERFAEIQNEAVKIPEQNNFQQPRNDSAPVNSKQPEPQQNIQQQQQHQTQQQTAPAQPKIQTQQTKQNIQSVQNQQNAPQRQTSQPAQQQQPKIQAQPQNQTPAQNSKPVSQVPDPKIRTDYPSNQQYRVQVGAYGSKEGANVEAKKLTKAGFHTTVFSNPASKHVRVWILAGNSKANAENILERAKSLGYKSSFIVAPAK